MISRNVWLGACLAACLTAGGARAADVKPETGEQPAPQGESAATQTPSTEGPSAKELSERLDEVDVKTKDAVVLGDIPLSFRIPGTDLSMHIYGFAELNWVHDFAAENADIDYSTFAPYLPLDGQPGGNNSNRDYLTARTSRIGIETAAPTKWGPLTLKVEGDFNNEPRSGSTALYGSTGNVYTQQATDSYNFRIRHAYGQFAGFLAGMTWSTFMDVDNLPETVDFNGPVGATFIRQAQLRYAYATPAAGTFTVALENSSTYVLDGRAEIDGTANAQYGVAMATSASAMPDLVVRWDKGFDWGAVSIRGVTQQLRINDYKGGFAQTRGWGAAVSGSVKLREDKDLLMLQVTGGDGIGRYLNYIEGAIYDGQGIKVEEAVGVVAGYAFHPADWVRVNAVFGGTMNFDNAYTDAVKAAGLDSGRFGVNRWVWQAHLGPIFTPVKAVDLGIEGIWGRRMTLVGERGEMVRLNFSAKYYFN